MTQTTSPGTPTLRGRPAGRPVSTIGAMTLPPDTSQDAPTRRLTVLLFSDDRATRDAVRIGVGDRPGEGVEIERWHECATAPAVEAAVRDGGYDVLILDGEAQPYGGLGLCRQLKNEVFECPPVIVLTGRPEDGWLGHWSQADALVAHPLDPDALCDAVVDVLT